MDGKKELHHPLPPNAAPVAVPEVHAQSAFLSVKQWNAEDRPREKLVDLGAENLSSAELLAILVGTGSTNMSAVDLTRKILDDQGGSLRRLGRMSLEELCKYKGVGEAKAITILAACEFGRRRSMEQDEVRPVMDSPEKIYQHFRRLEDNDTEEFHLMLLNQSLRLIKTICIGKGGLTNTAADTRIVLREALMAKATVIIICHNHPSGNPRPSATDDRLTDKISRAAQIMDIRLMDHIIIGDGKFYSYQMEGKL